MIKIIADENIPFLKGVLEPFSEIYYMPGRHITNQEVKDADALLIRTRTICNEELLNNSRVKFIGTATIGFDHIDKEYCDRNGIKWISAPGCNSSSVQQYIASALLRIASENGFSLKDKTIGIVGVGNVGKKVEKFAGIMGMRILLNDPPRARKEKNILFSDLETLLKESDFVTLHVPLNLRGRDKTFHLIDRDTLRMMKEGSWFINTSRGEVVETEALKQAITNERIGGTVLDVWENEPELDIPLMHMAFLATPHIAGYSTDGKVNGTAAIVRELSSFFGFPLTDWSPEQVPPPRLPEIIIDCNGKGNEEIIRRSVFHTYNIIEDDVKLRFDPSLFEKIRGNYPVRREFPAYTVSLRGCSMGIANQLKDLGFNVFV
jgi:erythronate-4-phosphate dehydrogenase